MLIKLTEIQKNVGAKALYKGVDLIIHPKERIGFIGRNGMGKSTLLRILAGLDHDFYGEVQKKTGVRVVMTLQEHTDLQQTTAMEYILREVPNYRDWESTIAAYESGELNDLQAYADAVEGFSNHGYYFIKDLILQSLNDFQIAASLVTEMPLKNLSGGQKRFVELVRVMYSGAELLLIDEPTNHMDYVGKELFINWLSQNNDAVVVVTHDRDVLRSVDKIMELKEQRIFQFEGNFAKYLSQNTTQTTNDVISYQNKLRQLRDAEKKVEWGNRMRAKSKAWKIKYDHFVRDYEKIKQSIEKPSFWIDKESVEELDERVTESYEQFKERNVKIVMKTSAKVENLLRVEHLSLGYQEPLFREVHFEMKSGARIFIKGRNGAGKSTLVKTILATYKELSPPAKIFDGKIIFAPGVRIGEYEQEIQEKYLHVTLGEAIHEAYLEVGKDIDDQKIKQLLAQYLFDPKLDINAKMSELSGGQKARFQVIKMLCNDPNLLILDEPTNHLDLPSIEELENALQSFSGGIIYISHDQYFVKNMGGTTITIGN
ncbi:MAG: ABC-F type ribosomal protection protein [Patescibacteria group bacterium]|nr:MAG: ABC-F type ribosomal protection protein [Patescibacteria group bacterium]